MKYIVFDLEWNMPFSAQNMVKEPSMLRGEIFEIGAVKLHKGKIVETFVLLLFLFLIKIMYFCTYELHVDT